MKELPDSGDWQFEPKWDGFRGVLENDGGELALWSRNGRPLLRYFPELRDALEKLRSQVDLWVASAAAFDSSRPMASGSSPTTALRTTRRWWRSARWWEVGR